MEVSRAEKEWTSAEWTRNGVDWICEDLSWNCADQNGSEGERTGVKSQEMSREGKAKNGSEKKRLDIDTNYKEARLDALRKDGEDDYILETTSAWITVNNISVHVIRTGEGVLVDLYSKGEETHEPMSSAFAHFTEAEGARVES